MAALRRALLYVPASSQKMLQKSRSLAVDTLTFDLEDSVAPSAKASARTNLRQFLSAHERPASVGEISVRINAVSTGLALEDLTSVACLKAPSLDCIVVPKVESPSDIHFVTDVLRHRKIFNAAGRMSAKPVKILALIESAKGVQSLSAICAASIHLSGLIFAAEDFALDLSLTRTPGLREFLYARSAIVTAAVAAGLPSIIDLVHTSYGSPEAQETLRAESSDGKRLGFNGKQIVHPDQINAVQTAFTPSQEEVTWAVRLDIAAQKAENCGKGAFGLDGKMIDRPVISKAKAIINFAEKCGLDVDSSREKWASQEPE